MAEVVKASAEHDTPLLLTDIRKVEYKAGAEEIFEEITLLGENTGLTQRHRHAIVVAQLGELDKSAEIISANRGHVAHFFTELEEAKSWLKRFRPPSTQTDGKL
jgi:hypothetical protein